MTDSSFVRESPVIKDYSATGKTTELGLQGKYNRNSRDITTEQLQTQTTSSFATALYTELETIGLSAIEAIGTDWNDNYKDILINASVSNWVRANNITNLIKANIDIIIEEQQTRWEEELQQMNVGRAVTAGSSRNSAVELLYIREQSELSRRVVAEKSKLVIDAIKHETEALIQAYQLEFKSREETRLNKMRTIEATLNLLHSGKISSEQTTSTDVDDIVSDIVIAANYSTSASWQRVQNDESSFNFAPFQELASVLGLDNQGMVSSALQTMLSAGLETL